MNYNGKMGKFLKHKTRQKNNVENIIKRAIERRTKKDDGERVRGKKVIKNNRKIQMKYNKQQQQQKQNNNNNKVNVPELNCKIQQKRLKQN